MNKSPAHFRPIVTAFYVAVCAACSSSADGVPDCPPPPTDTGELPGAFNDSCHMELTRNGVTLDSGDCDDNWAAKSRGEIGSDLKFSASNMHAEIIFNGISWTKLKGYKFPAGQGAAMPTMGVNFSYHTDEGFQLVTCFVQQDDGEIVVNTPMDEFSFEISSTKEVCEASINGLQYFIVHGSIDGTCEANDYKPVSFHVDF